MIFSCNTVEDGWYTMIGSEELYPGGPVITSNKGVVEIINGEYTRWTSDSSFWEAERYWDGAEGPCGGLKPGKDLVVTDIPSYITPERYLLTKLPTCAEAGESSVGYYAHPIYSKLDTPQSYVDAFITDARSYGYTFPWVKADPNVYFFPIDQSLFGLVPNPCVDSAQRGYIAVELNRDIWDGETTTDMYNARLWAMYHEFGHAYFGYDHTCDQTQIMGTRWCTTGQEQILEKKYTKAYYPNFLEAVDDFFEQRNQVYLNCPWPDQERNSDTDG